MGLSNITFILILILFFIPVYYLIPATARKYLVLVGSIIFYAIIDILVLPILIVNVLLAFLLGIKISSTEKASVKKGLCITGVVIQLLLMIASVVLSRTSLPLFAYHSFVGIGFITVVLIGYYIDVYRDPENVCKDIIDFYNFAFFFPKVLQGPIVSYKNMSSLRNPVEFNWDNLEHGIRTFILGLAMKVLLADRLYYLWNGVQTIGLNSIPTSLAWLAMYSYSIQLFLDFQGYSLMAIGIARMLGVTLPTNFKSPYMSRSISEFYRRWHMSLGNWFKEYIYIPLGGNRKGRAGTIFNLSMVWIATGLWHGLTVNFMLWALAILIFIILEKTVLAPMVKSDKLIATIPGHLYVLIIIPFTWMLFALRDVNSIGVFFFKLFDFTDKYNSVINPDSFYDYRNSYLPYLIGGLICCFPFVEDFFTKTRTALSRISSFVIFWICIYFVMKNGNNPFMYINF